MFQLRREFLEGPDRSELVLLHYSAAHSGAGGPGAIRSSLVMPPAEGGRRETRLLLPEPQGGGRYSVRYFFSVVKGGSEWYSPPFEAAVPDEGASAAGSRLPEVDGGNLRPAPGRGQFRLVLPLRDDDPRSGAVHFGFGAMRKKPSPSLCRAALPREAGRAPVADVPEALSVLKNRPMPYFLYHYVEGGGALRRDKIAPVRIVFADAAGDVLCARLLWADPSWEAPNITPMEAKNFPAGEGAAADDFFAGNREAHRAARFRRLLALPLPRTFEAFLFGPSGRDVEYCFQLLRRTPQGAVVAEWRNRPDGGNWRVTV